jgi:hypothetical protein
MGIGDDLRTEILTHLDEQTIGRLVWPHEFHADWYRYKHPNSDAFRDKLEALGMGAR